MRLDEYSAFDGLGLAALVRSGEVSSSELVALAIESVATIDPSIGAVVASYPDRIERASTRSATGGPFDGVPIILKDLFHGEPGWQCGNGSRLCDGWTVTRPDEFTARLHGAGFVPMGRSTTSEFGLLGTTETLAVGRTRSPWGEDTMAGGSSGGSGAVVGAGIVPIAGASDGGGSIRIPASACGVVGLKPSRGRVPWGPDTGEPLLGWAVHFVTSRTVRDTAAVLDVLAGPMAGDPFEISSRPSQYLAQLPQAPAPLRIAFWSQPWSDHQADPEVAGATEATARMLADLGHHVEPATPSIGVAWEVFMRAMTDIWSATSAHTIDGFAALLGRAVNETSLEAATLALVRHGRSVSSGRLLDCMDTVNVITRSMGSFFSSYDILLTPTLGALPAPLGRYDPDLASHPFDTFSAWSQWESFLPVFNATGQPAISLPLHVSATGLPIGMQLVGRFGSESLLLRLAASLEQAAPWSGRVPPLHVGRVPVSYAPGI